ncbi:MAG: hypothetical protein EON59_18580 [Alphaproteobacteria bacterium]|nr:MAG: hypothetical protein EON59_18580 [Alphaproteobacteria bacterium]
MTEHVGIAPGRAQAVTTLCSGPLRRVGTRPDCHRQMCHPPLSSLPATAWLTTARTNTFAATSTATRSKAASEVLKRGLIGTYHDVPEAHLKRYLVEFDFRHNRRSALKISDTERTDAALAGIGGKCLTYRRIGQGANA